MNTIETNCIQGYSHLEEKNEHFKINIRQDGLRDVIG